MSAIHAAVFAAHQQLLARFHQGNAAGIAALYAEDGQILPAHSSTIRGRAAIQAFWQGCIDLGICIMQRTPLKVDCLAETVNDVGDYTFFDRAGKVLDVGKYVLIWKKHPDSWQIDCDIWTTNLPAPGAGSSPTIGNKR